MENILQRVARNSKDRLSRKIDSYNGSVPKKVLMSLGELATPFSKADIIAANALINGGVSEESRFKIPLIYFGAKIAAYSGAAYVAYKAYKTIESLF